MNVTVVWATPAVQDEVSVELPQGATVRDAVAGSGLLVGHGIDAASLGYAIYGRKVDAGEPISDGDRVELTRPLVADPRQARARRAREAATREGRRKTPPSKG